MARRAYVNVVVEIFEDGRVRPLTVQWEDGRRFRVEKLLDVRSAASTRTGGQGLRYTVRISGRETYLFEDEGRWFVEAKA